MALSSVLAPVCGRVGGRKRERRRRRRREREREREKREEKTYNHVFTYGIISFSRWNTSHSESVCVHTCAGMCVLVIAHPRKALLQSAQFVFFVTTIEIQFQGAN